MIPANRTSLLLLEEKRRSYSGSLHILQARRQALIMELFRMSRPFLRSRERIRAEYGVALAELRQARAVAGRETLAGLAAMPVRPVGVEISRLNFFGVICKDLRVQGDIRRSPSERGYDVGASSIHLDQAIDSFERLAAAMVEMAVFENKLKRLSAEIITLSRKIKVLDEKILPRLRGQIHGIRQQIGEREREGHFRLKRFKGARADNWAHGPGTTA